LKYQIGLDSKQIQKIWDENEFNIGCVKEKEHALIVEPFIDASKLIRGGGLT